MKFRTKLFLFYIIGVGLMTLCLATYFVGFEENQVRRSWHEYELIQAKLIAANFSNESELKDPKQVQKIIQPFIKSIDGRLTIVNTRGIVLIDTFYNYLKMENHLNRPEIKEALSGRIGSSVRYSKTLNNWELYVAYPLKIQTKIVGVVRVSKTQKELSSLLLRLKLLIIGGIVLTAVLALIFGIIAMQRATEPILELKRLALGISKGDLSGRVKFFGQDELADLGLVFNSMAQQLSDSFAHQKEEKRKLEVILNNLADGILVIDRQLKLVLANPAACEMLGLNLENFKERPILELVMNHHLLDLIQEVNLSQQSFESQLMLHYPQNRQFQIFLAPLKDEGSGALAGSIVVLHDLTQLRRLERVRQDFVANVSHELRTPITTIKAMTETLLRGGWKDEQMLLRYLDATNKESDRLANLINDLLALARLDAKARQPFEPFDLIQVIREIEEQFVSSKENPSRFQVVLPDDKLPKAYGNADQIRQVLINLLENAFKYTPNDGQIRLSAWRDGEMLKVSVSDTGIGIPEHELSRIFERFYRVDKARSREMGGTGLGLSIVKHIVETHGGQVMVESTQGQGSIFSFTIPVEGPTYIE